MPSVAQSILNAISAIAGTYFAFWLLIAAALGVAFPDLFNWVGPNIALMIGIVMFGVGAMLEPKDLRDVLVRPWEVLGGVAAQFAIMGPLALIVALAFQLPIDLTVGMVLVGTAPGGTASNVITLLARGDVALSVSITSVSTFLAPLLTPILTLWLIGTAVDVDASALLVSILKIIIIPVALGQALNIFFRRRIEPFRPVLPLISVLAIMLIIAFVIGVNWDRFQTVGGALIGAVIAHNLLGLALGYALARLAGLSMPKRKAICFEVGMQNSGLAVALATLHFNPIAALPGALFSLWHNISGSLLATVWRRQDKVEPEPIAPPSG